MIGLGVAGFLVAWNDDSFYMKQQPVNYDAREWYSFIYLFIFLW